MKNKIVMIAAFLAVMVSMTGIAAATGIDATPDPITVDIGQTGTQNIIITAGTSTGDHVEGLLVTGVKINGVPTSFDVSSKFTVKITDESSTSYTCILGTPCQVGGPGIGNYGPSETFVVSFKNDQGAPNADYTVQYTGYYTGGSIQKDSTVKTNVIAIPEFPTVALPIAAVLGLVFFFHRRKNKEE